MWHLANDDLSLPKGELSLPISPAWINLLSRATWLTSTATVQKIISEILPASSGQTFSKDARDLLMECCVEFITLISSEANDISEKEAKKTIACEHVEKALRDLGFGDYIPDVLAVAEEHKEQLKVCIGFCFSSLGQLLTRSAVTGKETEQDGAEWVIRGGALTAATRAVPICDGEI